MHLGHQRTGGIEHAQATRLGLAAHGLRDAVGGENDDGTGRRGIEFVDKDRALGLQVIDHEAVMHHLVADINRRAEFFQRLFDDGDRPFDAGAKAPRIGQQDAHRMPTISASKRSVWPASG